MSTTDYLTLDRAIVTGTLEYVLSRAEAGDVQAAHDTLLSISHYLSVDNVDPKTNEPYPVPLFLREYLSNAFRRIAKDNDANKALNLKRRGRKNRNYIQTMLGAYLVYQGVHGHAQTVMDAVHNAADFINDESTNDKFTGVWSCLKREKIEPENLQDWYYKHLDVLKDLHEKFTLRKDLDK
jgi:hypothetical protein